MYQSLLSTTRPTAPVARGLWSRIASASNSSNAIARTVHANSSRVWTDRELQELLTSFASTSATVAGRGRRYNQASNAQRKDIIQSLSLEFHRSPMAIKIRLDLLAAPGFKRATAPTVAPQVVSDTITQSDAIANATMRSAPMQMADIQVSTATVEDPTTAAIRKLIQDRVDQLAAVTPKEEVPYTFETAALRGIYGA